MHHQCSMSTVPVTRLVVVLALMSACFITTGWAQGPAGACDLAEVTSYRGVSTDIVIDSRTGDSIVLFYCPPDKELRGIGFKKCTLGKWTSPESVPRCANLYDCPPPLPFVDNGHLNKSAPHHYNDAVKLDCDSGYTLVNGAVATCGLNGWSTKKLGTCHKFCKIPPIGGIVKARVTNDTLSHHKRRVSVGAQLQYYCKSPGYKLVVTGGNDVVQCTQDGLTATITPTCKARACALKRLLSGNGNIPNGMQVSPHQDKYRLGQTIRLSCAADSQERRRHVYPVMASTYFMCEAESNQPGSTLLWRHANGTAVRKDRLLTLECLRYCQLSHMSKNGQTSTRVRFAPSHEDQRIGESVRISCVGEHRELLPAGLRTWGATCSKESTWKVDGEPLTEEIICRATHCRRPDNVGPLLQITASGVSLTSERHFPIGQQLNFSCGVHSIVGLVRTIQCIRNENEAAWHQPWPTCVQRRNDCTDLTQVAHGQLVQSPSDDDTVGLRCDKCYRPSGKVTTTCTQSTNITDITARWLPDITATTCQVIECPPLPVSENPGGAADGQLTANTTSNTCGTTVKVSCAGKPYSILGAKTLQCLPSGRWSDCIPKCIKTRCAHSHSRCKGPHQCTEKRINGSRNVLELCRCVPVDSCPSCPEANPVCGAQAITSPSECHLASEQCTLGGDTAEPNFTNGVCTKGGVCSEPKPHEKAGTVCDPQFSKWYFDVETKMCKPYYHGSCYVGDNSFNLETECRTACYRAPDSCGQPKGDVGPCLNGTTRYTFDADTKICEPFIYGGCGGNANNFADAATCTKACIAPKSSTHGSGAIKSPCSDKPCSHGSMEAACPVEDASVFVLLAKVTAQTQASVPNVTVFRVLATDLLHRPSFMNPIYGAFTYYHVLRVDGGDARCGCPDLQKGNFFIIGRATKSQEGSIYLLLDDEQSYVEQYDPANANDAARGFAARLRTACPHLQYTAAPRS